MSRDMLISVPNCKEEPGSGFIFFQKSCSGDIEGLDQDQTLWWLHCVYYHYTRVGQVVHPS